MNHIQDIGNHCQTLPEELQKQVLDFVCFLEARYAPNQNTELDDGLTEAELKQACGVLKAPQGVSLAQLDAAIKKRGAKI